MLNKITADLNEMVLKKNFNRTSGWCGCDERFRLMIRKGIYPYGYMDSLIKFEETKLQPKNAF